jgi:hypothetical protein
MSRQKAESASHMIEGKPPPLASKLEFKTLIYLGTQIFAGVLPIRKGHDIIPSAEA